MSFSICHCQRCFCSSKSVSSWSRQLDSCFSPCPPSLPFPHTLLRWSLHLSPRSSVYFKAYFLLLRSQSKAALFQAVSVPTGTEPSISVLPVYLGNPYCWRKGSAGRIAPLSPHVERTAYASRSASEHSFLMQTDAKSKVSNYQETFLIGVNVSFQRVSINECMF